MELTKEGKLELLKAVAEQFKKGKGKAAELLNEFKDNYKKLTPQEKDTLALSLGGFGMGAGLGYGIGKKADVVFSKLAKKERLSQAGGSLIGGVAGALTGSRIAEKLLAKASKAPSKPLKTALTLAAGIAGLYPGEVIGRHVGEGVDELLGTGKYKDRGSYKKLLKARG